MTTIEGAAGVLSGSAAGEGHRSRGSAADTRGSGARAAATRGLELAPAGTAKQSTYDAKFERHLKCILCLFFGIIHTID